MDAEQIDRPEREAPTAFQRNPQKYVMLPSNARVQRVNLRERLERLQEYAENTPLNFIDWGDRSLGIISHSMAYQYAREVFPNASFLKLGMAYPLPRNLIIEFARQVDTLLIVEELDPFLEEQILALPDLPRCARAGQGGLPGDRRVQPAVGGPVRHRARPARRGRRALPAGRRKTTVLRTR